MQLMQQKREERIRVAKEDKLISYLNNHQIKTHDNLKNFYL